MTNIKVRGAGGTIFEVPAAYGIGQEVWAAGVRYAACPHCRLAGGVGYEPKRQAVGPLVISHIGIGSPDYRPDDDGVRHEVLYLTKPARADIDLGRFSGRFMECELFTDRESAQLAADACQNHVSLIVLRSGK